jgi:glucosamine kinase
MVNTPIYLGFDGGGTKTECIAADSSGKPLGRGAAGPSNALRVTYESAITELKLAGAGAVHATNADHGVVRGVCAGLAGAGSAGVSARIAQSLAKIWPQANIRVITDADAALVAAAGTGPAVVVIAGTGSIAIGRNAKGEVARAGGYGPWIGDPGSAYDMGRRAVEAAARAREGAGPATSLTPAISVALQCAAWEQVTEQVAAAPESVFPRLFPIVVAAAEAGDQVARNILSQAALDLSKLALAVVGRLGMKDEKLTLARTGGVFGRTLLLDGRLDSLIARVMPRAHAAPLSVSPALAAARLAIQLVRERK